MISLVLVIPFLVFGLGIALGVWRRRSNRVTEPSCGKCRYCVRGLEGFICPECGSDLREVGILTPGTTPPLSRPKRMLIWLMFAPLPTMLIGGVLMPICGPQLLRTTQRRVIFSQVPYCNAIITANGESRRLTFGMQRPSKQPAGAPDVVFLTTAASPNSSLDIRPATRSFQYFDKTGKLVKGPYDAKGVEKWLNELGFNDPRVADRAADIVNTVDEIGTPAGNGFTKFARDSTVSNPSTGIAHPTFNFTRTEANEATWIAGGILFVIVWLAGLPFIWRDRQPRSMGVPPMSLQSTAETAVLR